MTEQDIRNWNLTFDIGNEHLLPHEPLDPFECSDLSFFEVMGNLGVNND